jgi:hypothetical protein
VAGCSLGELICSLCAETPNSSGVYCSEQPATNAPLGCKRTFRLRVNRLFLRGAPVEVVEVRDRLEALAREVRLISLGLFGIAYLHKNGDDTGPLIDFATQVEDKLLALALEIHPYEEKGLASAGGGVRKRSADKLPKPGKLGSPLTPVRTAFVRPHSRRP